MGKRFKEEEKLDPPMSAMIDVVFLLLIFFIATFKEHKVEAHIAVNLPTPNLKQPNPEAIFVEIHILKDQYFFMGKPTTLDQLERELQTIASYNNKNTIMIKVHPSAPEERLVWVLDRCSKYKLTELNILTLKE